jgi:hypothetical protein
MVAGHRGYQLPATQGPRGFPGAQPCGRVRWMLACSRLRAFR